MYWCKKGGGQREYERPEAILSHNPLLPQVFEIMSEASPSEDDIMLPSAGCFMCCPLCMVAMFYSSQVGTCILRIPALPSLYLVLTLNHLPCPSSLDSGPYPGSVHSQWLTPIQ